MADLPPAPRHRWFAALYDPMGRLNETRMEPLRRRLLQGVTGDVLEVGCGTGANLEHYQWASIARLEATEPDPFMLRRAREKLEAMETARERAHLTDAPAEALPFEDGRFDFVVSCLVLCTVGDPRRSLAEMRRVLKPGGELRLLEHVAADGGWRKAQRVVQPVYGWLSGECRLDRETEALVRDAGFSLDVWERMSFSPLHPAFLGAAHAG